MKKSNEVQPHSIPANAYAMGGDMMAAIQQVQALIKQRSAIDEKIEASRRDAKAAEDPHHAALAAQAQADATLAMSVGERENIKNEKAADAAAELVDATLRAKTRLVRTTEALCKMAADTDAAIIEAGVMLDVERGIFSQEAAETFAADLNEAIKPLVALMLRGNALYGATRDGALGQFLHETVVYDPRDLSGRYLLIGDGSAMVDNQRINLAAAGQSDAGALAISAAIAPLVEAKRQLSAHRPFVHPDQRPKPYVVKGTSHGPGRAFGDSEIIRASNMSSAR